jgi:hypothetical protein
MKLVNNFIRSHSVCFAKSILIITSIAIPILIPHPASAKDFRIGAVKEQQQFQTDSLCYTLLPNTNKFAIVSPSVDKGKPVFAWINIDGKDIRLREVMSKRDKRNGRSINKYQANNISVTVEARKIKEVQEPVYILTTADRVSIEYRGHKKVINASGTCMN